MRLPLLVLFIVFGWVSQGFTQAPPLVFNHLTLKDGLSEATNVDIYKDSRGFVWISSISGLNRFDGTHVKVYLPDGKPGSIRGENIQSSFFEEPDGKMWFTTYEAINCYDPEHDSFTNFTIPDSSGRPQVGYHIFHIDGQSRLWVIMETKEFLVFDIPTKKFQHVSWLTLNCSRAAYSVDTKTNTHLVITYRSQSDGIELLYLNDSLEVVRDTTIERNINNEKLIARRILVEGDSLVWLFNNDRINRITLSDYKAYPLPIEGIISAVPLNKNYLLTAYSGRGVAALDKDSQQISRFYSHEADNDLTVLSDRIVFMSRDRDGGIWLNSPNNGISFAYPGKSKFKLTRITSAETGETLQDLRGFHLDTRGNIIGHSNFHGIGALINGNIFSLLWKPQNELQRLQLFTSRKTITGNHGNIWALTFSGALLLKPDGTLKSLTDQSQVLTNGVRLPNGRLIFLGAYGGIFEAFDEPGQERIERILPGEFEIEHDMAGYDYKGNLWVSESIRRMIILDGNSLKPVAELPIISYPVQLANDVENQTIWLATTLGLFEIDATNYTIRKAYYEPEIPCAIFTNIVLDKKGTLWLTCRNRIMSLDTKTKEIHLYNELDGLPNEQFSWPGNYQYEDGTILFATSGNIVRFHPDDVRPVEIKAIPQITSWLINDKPATAEVACELTGATHITNIEKITLPFDQNTLSFVVNALEYSAPAYNKVLYKMEGIDREAIETANGSFVRYPNLPAGEYTFTIKASNSDGIYSDMVRRLIIVIRPPFYKTWWFITLVILVALGLVFYIVYINFSKRLELQKVRLRLYENLHDDVGSRLMAIVLSAEEMIQRDKVAHPRLTKISAIAKSIVDNMKRLVWATDPVNDKMENVLSKIRYDKSLILSDDMQFVLDVPQELMRLEIPGETRYQISSVINEALNNINKYAKATKVEIRMRKTGGMLQVDIEDNGIGFDMADASRDQVKGSGYGLGNMKKRIDRVKGQLTVNSVPGKGTTIGMLIPV